MVKLVIKQTETRAGYILALCDEAGDALPNQMSVNVDSRPGDIVKATVVFAVGDDVAIVNGDHLSPIK